MTNVKHGNRNFWALVRLELTHNLLSSPSFGAVIFFCVFWIGTNIMPFFLSTFQVNYLEYSPFSPLGPLWLCVVGAMFAEAHVPSLLTQRSLFHPASFLWTRAIDRRLLFRAKSIAVTLLLIAPLFLSLALAFYSPEMTIGIRNGDAAAFAAELQRAFGKGSGEGGQIILTSGNVAFSLWHVVLALLGICTVHGVFLVIAPLIKRIRPSLGGAVLAAALVAVAIVFGLLFHNGANNHLYRYLFFSFVDHWWAWMLVTVLLLVPIQLLSERRYAEQELP